MRACDKLLLLKNKIYVLLFFLKFNIDKQLFVLYNQSVNEKKEKNSSIHKEENQMKEKRILAMFITSIVTLVASLSVTFGILTTLADPVEATGVTRYAFAFNDVNAEGIKVDGNTLSLTEEIYFSPSDNLRWNEFVNAEASDEEDPVTPILINGTAYDESIQYYDETVSTRVKMIPFRITNKNTDDVALVDVEIVFDKTTTIGKWTQVKFYDYENGKFVDQVKGLTLASNAYRDYVAIVYVDQTANLGQNKVAFSTDYEKINIKITNNKITTID